MKILILTWKDQKHPLAGGAEKVNEELARRLVKDNHEVILLVGGFSGGKHVEDINGYKVIRVGNRYAVYPKAFLYYRKHLKGWADLIIDEINTIPFFAKLYTTEPTHLFVHQLCREIWFYQMPPPLSFIGYTLEPLYLRLLNDQKVITVSESTKSDLIKHGFSSNAINIISEGIDIEPLVNIIGIKKEPSPTLLSFGSIRPMKRTLDQIKAFEFAKSKIPNLKLIIAGDTSDAYAKQISDYILKSNFKDSIKSLGPVSDQKKIELMQKCHLLIATPVKEGWGLTVTEAASQGTPAVVYDVDGLRDSVRNGRTGIITDCNPQSLANGVVEALDSQKYSQLRFDAWQWSQDITFDNAYKGFKEAVGI